ncbi:MAG: phosphoribosyltransferase family protein, partial [Spirochaetales bacterium]
LEELKKTHIIVVDDIITTGSTMKSALDTLESLGFESLSGASWLCEL